MNTLNKYLLKQSFAPFLLSVAVITTVLFLQFLIRAVDRFLGKGLDIFTIFEYLYLNLAWIIALSVPMSLLISSVMTFGRMSQKNEITALKSAGINFFNIIKPSMWFGTLIAILLCIFNNFILPEMNYNARLLAKDIYTKKPELSIEPGYFIDMIPQYTRIVKNIEGNILTDIKIFSKNKKTEQTSIYAQTGSISSNGNIITIDLYDGEIHEIDLKDFDYYRKIKFQSHKIMISINDLILNRSDNDNRTDREMKVPEMITKIKKNKEKISTINQRIENIKQEVGLFTSPKTNNDILNEFKNKKEILIKNTKKNSSIKSDSETKENILSLNNYERQLENELNLLENYIKTNNKFKVEIHKKFTLALACILFTLVGAPLGILIKKGGMTIAAGLSITFFLIYYILLIWGEQLADRNLINPGLGSWIPNIILFLIGVILIFYSNKRN